MIIRRKIGPRMSQVVTHSGATVYVSGQVADDGKVSIQEQTRQVLAKIEALLSEAGATKSHLLAVNVYLPNITDFDAMNSVYDAWIDPLNPPARACIEARLADPNLRVEMTAVASLEGSDSDAR